ncbi:MAG: PH domain-containing protein [Erysipelothrix sp.]|nr:PH domain-containing protein [Erysipelothrix sp.]
MNQFDQIPAEFEVVKDYDEHILWNGKPSFVPFLAQGIPFLLIGLVWGAFDYFFVMSILNDGFGGMSTFLIPFMLVHLFPFWGSILNMFRLALVYKNVSYAITTKRVMLRSGFFGIDFKAVDFDMIQNMEVNVGPLEKLFNVGSIRLFSGEAMSTKNGMRSMYDTFKAIENPYGVFKQLKQVSMDIRSDLNYPNQYRPEENQGYRTKYKG